MAPTLRERNKARTRAEILLVAGALFRSQGYDATTLEQICADVSISVPTLLAYFPSKERLALAGEWDAVEDLRRRLGDPGRSDAITVWRAWVEDTSKWTAANKRSQAQWFRIEAGTPALVRGRHAILQAYEDALASALAADHGTDPEKDLPTRFTATMLAFGYRTVVRQWRATGHTDDLVANALGVIDVAAAYFESAR